MKPSPEQLAGMVEIINLAVSRAAIHQAKMMMDEYPDATEASLSVIATVGFLSGISAFAELRKAGMTDAEILAATEKAAGKMGITKTPQVSITPLLDPGRN